MTDGPSKSCGATDSLVIGRCGRDADHRGKHRSTGPDYEAYWGSDDERPARELCGARATGINNGLTCGKTPHDVEVDPVHRFAAGDPASLEWTDPAAHLDDVTSKARTDTAEQPSEAYPEIPEDQRRPLGWLFNKGVRADG